MLLLVIGAPDVFLLFQLLSSGNVPVFQVFLEPFLKEENQENRSSMMLSLSVSTV